MEAKQKATSAPKLSLVCKEDIHNFIQKKEKKSMSTDVRFIWTKEQKKLLCSLWCLILRFIKAQLLKKKLFQEHITLILWLIYIYIYKKKIND